MWRYKKYCKNQELTPSRLTLESHVHQCLQDLHVAAAETRAKGLAQVLGHVGGHVDAHLVDQRGGAHGEAEAGGEGVQFLGVHPFLQ